MRITKGEVLTEDILWFGTDKNVFLFACTSAGSHKVPEFVCKSKEEIEFLEKYFFTTLGIDEKDFDNDEVLANRGLFYFDAIVETIPKSEDFFKYLYCYKKSVKFSPKNPLHFDQLQKHIQEIMDSHRVDIDVFHDVYMNVDQAYKEFCESWSGNIKID